MKYQEVIDKQEVMQLINRRIKKRLESAAINDRVKADELLEVAEEIGRMPGAEEWRSPDEKPPAEILVLLRVDFEGTDRRPRSRSVGTGTYHIDKNGQAYWLHTNGQRIKWPVTGWQYMPKP